MIKFLNNNNSEPFLKIKKYYDEALVLKQPSIDAISISSYNKHTKEVNSRLVNLKFIDNDEFIFFTNYNSPKSIEFESHSQISAILFWPSINIQIRLKSTIERKSPEYNNDYFKSRSLEKNALAISSNQSNSIRSYEEVVNKYNFTKSNDNLLNCPKYWGGYSFRPYKIEFWQGNEFRLNKRDLYKKNKNNIWNHSILEP